MDVAHYWTGDISAAANGDIAMVDGIALGTQRVIRRLMTAPGEYIWHPDYGAGLPQRIGQPYDSRVITAVIRAQIFMEACVAKTPAPKITLQTIINGIQVSIKYTDQFAQKLVAVTFPVHARPFSQPSQSALSVEVPV
jgi:phage baseplate assembly protein W